MKVKDLINQLEKFDENLDVRVATVDDSDGFPCWSISNCVKEVEIRKDRYTENTPSVVLYGY